MLVYDPMMRHGDGCVLRPGHDGDCATLAMRRPPQWAGAGPARCCAPQQPTLETPEDFANRPAVWCLLYPALAGSVARDVAAKVARARDKQTIAKCRELAEAAEREAAAHPSPDRVAYCDGQASAFRAMAALLERL